MARFNKAITVVAATPINVATGMTSAQMVTAGFSQIPRQLVKRVFLQMKVAGTGLGYVMDGIRGQTSATQQWRVPASSVSGDLTAQLAPATATAPGGSYGDSDPNAGIDLSQTWIDGSVNGDVITVSYDTKT